MTQPQDHFDAREYKRLKAIGDRMAQQFIDTARNCARDYPHDEITPAANLEEAEITFRSHNLAALTVVNECFRREGYEASTVTRPHVSMPNLHAFTVKEAMTPLALSCFRDALQTAYSRTKPLPVLGTGIRAR